MYRYFDFQCAKGHVTEHLVESDVTSLECPHCGNEAMRLISAPRISLDGCSGDFPTASDAWVRRRESHIAWERKTGRSEQYSG
jgi:predicted nucleic acid-binding Zn ribbon protein